MDKAQEKLQKEAELGRTMMKITKTRQELAELQQKANDLATEIEQMK